MRKIIESIAGTVQMADGSRRVAYRNTYPVTVFSADGTSAKTEQEVRVEFELDTNANAMAGRRYRKATAKQAETFNAR